MRVLHLYTLRPEPDRVREVAPEHATYWRGLGDVRIGRQSSIALDGGGRAHVSYYLGDAFEEAAVNLAVSTPVEDAST
jgi:hypothetical protein